MDEADEIQESLRSARDLAGLRHRLARQLLLRSVVGTDIHDVVLAVHEAAKNSIRFSNATHAPVRVTIRFRNGEITVRVADRGCGFDPSRCDLDWLPDLEKPSGRGLFLMYQLMDHVHVMSGAFGSVVRMSKRLTLETRVREAG